MSYPENEAVRRLRWQCRRGMLELDILLTRFLDERYAALSAPEQAGFRYLLEQPDHNLLAWFQRRQEPPANLKTIVDKVI